MIIIMIIIIIYIYNFFFFFYLLVFVVLNVLSAPLDKPVLSFCCYRRLSLSCEKEKCIPLVIRPLVLLKIIVIA